MKAGKKRDLVMLNATALENFYVSDSQKFRIIIHKRHEKTSLSNNVRSKCVTK